MGLMMYKIKNDILAASCVASILFVAIICLGLSLAILPLFVNKILHLSPLFVGGVISVESISTLLSRASSGRYSDKKGPKKGMIAGLTLIVLSGVLVCISFVLKENVIASYIVLIISRIIMGVGESLVFTCSGTWPIGLVGREHAGKIMSWVGIAMFMGLALGNYIGVWSFYKYNIMVSAISITLFPLLGFIIVCIVRSVHYHPDVISPSIVYGIRKIWRAGTGFALANIGYASITTFLVLLFIDNDWGRYSALGLSLFGIGYVTSRLTIGWAADHVGLKTTIFSLALEALGLLFVGLSVNMYLSMFGAFLTGFGLSMVYPLLALPAIKNMPEENIGFAISLYESCFDIGILISGFLGGLIVSCFGLQYIFYFSFICCLIAIPLSVMAYQVSSTLNKECR